MTDIADSFARQTALLLAMEMIDHLAHRPNFRSVFDVAISPTEPQVTDLVFGGNRLSTSDAQLHLVELVAERLCVYIHSEHVFIPKLAGHEVIFGGTTPGPLATQLLFTALTYAIKTRTSGPADLPATVASLVDFEKFVARIRVRVGLQFEAGFDPTFAEARDTGNLTARFFATLAPSD